MKPTCTGCFQTFSSIKGIQNHWRQTQNQACRDKYDEIETLLPGIAEYTQSTSQVAMGLDFFWIL